MGIVLEFKGRPAKSPTTVKTSSFTIKGVKHLAYSMDDIEETLRRIENTGLDGSVSDLFEAMKNSEYFKRK